MPKPNSDCRATERKHPWPMVRLGDVCIVQRGVRVTRKDLDDNGKYNVYQNSLKPLGKYNSFNCEAHSPFMIMALAAGEPGFSEEPFWAADDCTYFKNLKGLDNLYLYFLLSANKDELKRNVKQTTIPRLSNKFLESLEIPLPPLSVQREIVSRLEWELAAVEKMKKGFETLAETAKAEFKAELKEVFEKQGQALASGRLGWRKLGEICELISDCPHTTAKDEGVGIPLIRTPNVGFTRLILAGVHRVSEDVYEQRTKRAIPLPGDLIFAREAPAGNVAVIQSGEKVCLGQRTVLLRLRKGCFSDYIAYSVLQPESQKILIQKSTGSTVSHVNVCDIKTFPIHIPPLSVQREVVARLDSAKARAEKLEAKAREGVAVCETMRKAILKEAFDDGRASPAIGKATG